MQCITFRHPYAPWVTDEAILEQRTRAGAKPHEYRFGTLPLRTAVYQLCDLHDDAVADCLQSAAVAQKCAVRRPPRAPRLSQANTPLHGVACCRQRPAGLPTVRCWSGSSTSFAIERPSSSAVCLASMRRPCVRYAHRPIGLRVGLIARHSVCEHRPLARSLTPSPPVAAMLLRHGPVPACPRCRRCCPSVSKDRAQRRHRRRSR